MSRRWSPGNNVSVTHQLSYVHEGFIKSQSAHTLLLPLVCTQASLVGEMAGRQAGRQAGREAVRVYMCALDLVVPTRPLSALLVAAASLAVRLARCLDIPHCAQPRRHGAARRCRARSPTLDTAGK